MDPPPDPAMVGKAFVKQYYTQMHRDPTQMHRFYLEQSSFVHGGSEIGSEEPVIGQKAIHHKIVSLDLRQVHAKIKQVDSHMTLGLGIVIQVTGELSTGGHPMRAFVQTFVLAPESPKKYYVHNDMFRYQDDDLVSESETNEGPGESDNLPAVDLTSADEGEFPTAHHSEGALPEGGKEEEGLYVGAEAELGGGAEQGLPEPTAEPGGGGGGAAWDHYEDTAGLTELQQNGLVGEEGREDEGESPAQQVPLQEYVDPPPAHVTVAEVEAEQDGFPPSEPQEVDLPKGTATWASRLTHGGFPAGSTPKPPPTQVPRPRPVSSTSVPSQALPQREQRPRRMDAPRGAPPTGKDPSRKATSLVSPRDAPDTFQIFVGGLPTHTTEEELKSVFVPYGNIIEVRVNPKNFAFIVFDNPDSVQKIINQKDRLHLREKSLNIEAKRPSAPRSGSAGSRGKPLLNQGSGGGKPQRIGKVAKR